MTLTTAADMATLSSRSFLTDYASNQAKFIALGKHVYQSLAAKGPAPAKADMETPLDVFLQGATFFNTLCASKRYANPIFYPTFSLALARYTLDQEWGINIP